MKNRKTALSADISYMIMFLLLFISVAYITLTEQVSFHIAALCITFAIMIITHFTSVTLGLIINVVIIFAGFSWFLYRMLSYGEMINQGFYFWAVMSPVLTTVSHMMFRSVLRIEEENIGLQKRVRHFSIIDDVMELKNIQAYEMEFPVYQRIAMRYDIGLMLIIFQLRYADDLKKMLGQRNMDETAIQISQTVAEVFRREDVVYILSKDPYEWGSLLLSKQESADLLKERVKNKLEQMDFSEILGKNAPKLEIRVGVYYTHQGDETALSMIEKAKNMLQYDV